MPRRIALLNVVALGVALALFLWANFQPERVILVSVESGRCEVHRRGPGWPVTAYEKGIVFQGSEPALNDLTMDPYQESNKRAAIKVWMLNGPVGLLFLVALVKNCRLLLRSDKKPDLAAGTKD